MLRDLGWAALFPSAVDSSLTMAWGGRTFSGTQKSEDDFTSDWVGITGITGGCENNHLSSLRNAWGNVGVSLVGYLIHLPRFPQVCPVKEAQVEKDHSS